jgi:WD40 repeat protein
MQSQFPCTIVLGVLTVAAALPARGEEVKKAAKVNYEEQVSAIFKNRCNGCHNADKQKGGLNLETYGTAMQGGGSGKVIEPGDLEASTLYQLVSHKDEPSMPPNAPKIPDAEIEVIKVWIEGGAAETSGSVAVVKARPKFEFKLDPSASGRPAGPAAMPEGLSVEPVVVSKRPGAIIALAASPWAPLVAIGGHKQVLLYHCQSRRLLGVLPFPEGTVHVLKFSRNGALLLAGGGRGGQSGLAVVWDVKTGKRVFEVGKEYDAVLAADISPDHGMVALGGPSKVLRVYNTADGQLVYQSKKHTEWVTAVEFSADGVLLASGDRNNGLLVWEADTGREFYDLRGHTAAITDISWRPDSNVVASASEDGSIRLWEMENGKQIKSLNAHAGGALSVRYTQDGRLVSTGRDRVARLWDSNGNKVRDFEPFADLALEAVATHDNALIVAGDWTGEVRVWDAKDGRRQGTLSANPPRTEPTLAQSPGSGN